MTQRFPSPSVETVEHYVGQGFWTQEVLGAYVDRWRKQQPDKPALLHGDVTITYGELATRIDRFAAGLQGLGIGKGDVVAVQLPNVPEFVVAYLGLCRVGAVMQTIHMPYRGAELEFLLRHGGARAFICLSQFKDVAPAELAVAMKSRCPDLEQVISLGPAPDGAVGYDAVLSSYAPSAFPNLDGADPFLLLYTSGTTADPKGVPHAYRSFLCNARLSIAELEVSAGDILLTLAPVTHLYGLFVFHLAFLSGATSSLLPAFSPPDFVRIVEAHRASRIFAAPAHLAASHNAGLLDNHDLSSVRSICLSGSAVPPALARAVEEKLPTGVTTQLWGMSELQAGCYTRPSDAPTTRHETAGAASPGTQLRVLDDDNNELPSGSEGRLQVKGPSVFAGYLNNPDATAASFDTEGWFETGDTARIDISGNVTITGRVKEIINRGGVKFNPIDIEIIVDRMDGVERSAVVPFPDPVLGERACLFLVLDGSKTVTLDDVCAVLENEDIAKFKWPERLETIDAMPLTPTQKIMRGRLSDRLTNTGEE